MTIPGKNASESYQFLQKQPLFKGISPESLAFLAQSAQLKRIPKGTFIFFQGDAAEAVYLVRNGAIAIMLDSFDGRELVINELRAGDCFGELSVITSQTRSTSAAASADSEICMIPRQAFLTVLDNEGGLVRRMLELTASRLQASSERESALAFFNAEARLARVLINLDRKAIAKGYMTISQEELAQRTGLTRQTVAKALGRWRRLGWLLTGPGRIMLLNRDALREIQEQTTF